MIRIATWNIERPKSANQTRSQRILAKIGEIGADIWILTETHDAIQPDSDYHVASTPTVTVPPISHDEGEHKASIWSQWPIIRQVKTSTEHRATCVILDTPYGDIVVYGMVLPYHAAKWPYGTPRKWDAHYAAIATQGADWLRLRREYPGSGFCVAGDFNQARFGRYTYGTKWGRKLLDLALEENRLVGITQPDFPAAEELDQEEQELLAKNIDHICLDRRMTSRVAGIGIWPGKTAEGNYLSDHNGVFVDVEI